MNVWKYLSFHLCVYDYKDICTVYGLMYEIVNVWKNVCMNVRIY